MIAMVDWEQLERLRPILAEANQRRQQQEQLRRQEHLELLTHGVESWNQWRRTQPDFRPDLSKADLLDVNLSRADLNGANLVDADLRWANLLDANLSKASLFGASLEGAYLVGTNLSGASLSNAYLVDTHLSGADLTEAHFSQTTFARIDLSCVKGLETAIHNGPSIIDINSVALPTDEYTRIHFLRGVGFTETQIEYLPS